MASYKRANRNRLFIKIAVCLSAVFVLMGSVSAVAGGYRLSVDGDRLLLNGQAIKVIGLRCSNALISDSTTRQLIDNLDVFKSYGVNTVSVYFMGSRFGDVKGYRRDGSLDPVYAARMARIIEAADRRGMIVLVGCMYWSNSRAKEDLDAVWTQSDADKAVGNTIRWLSDNGYRNVFVDPDNEGMAHKSKGWSIASMIDAGHAVDPSILIANNSKGTPPPNADLYIHHSEKVPGRPWIQTEGSARGAPHGGYWGGYSKKEGYYNYINIGVYTDAMKKNQIDDTDRDIHQFNGYMQASTWLQCVAPYGPNMRPGGDGSKNNPGIRWWLEHVRDTFGGPWVPPAPSTVGRWDRFEASVANSRHYADPFRDVSLDVVYTRPDGTQKTFWGFYDGNGRWRIRFMPDTLGTWRYTARFSDGSRGVSGSFDCVASDIPGMISRDETNPVWMGFKGGKHVLVRSFHCGDRLFADTDNSITGEKWSPEMRRAFLDWAGKQGYNMLSVASHYLNRNVDGRGRG
ncbi:MAG: DUF5060 domain-containing protein, partial [Candidatus Hydrogenedentes bacterium]|nr:DUF5060 domain-containing protein [Candidatus Hydrogenedentota bacterium]